MSRFILIVVMIVLEIIRTGDFIIFGLISKIKECLIERGCGYITMPKNTVYVFRTSIRELSTTAASQQ